MSMGLTMREKDALPHLLVDEYKRAERKQRIRISDTLIRHAWWWVLFPGLALMLFVTSIFFVARAYETELSPQMKG